MSQGNYVPDRGDFIWISFDPQSGHEQASRRPALVVSPRTYNSSSGLALICPITVLPVTGVVLADHAKSLDWFTRRAVFIGAAPASVVDEVIQKLQILLS